MTGRKILVTTGSTHEKIDPVRYIGNYSTGKMGVAVAESLADSEAEIILVSGPASATTNHRNITTVKVKTANEMYEECINRFPSCDGAVMVAAVADYTPINISMEKRKRGSDNLTLTLKPTKDIAASLGKIKRDDQILVGFALETNDEIKNAQKKLKRKNFDFIVLNSLKDKGAGFGTDTNKITIITKDNNIMPFELKSKREAADDISGLITVFFNKAESSSL